MRWLAGLGLIYVFAFPAHAEPARLTLDEKNSTLTFTATVNQAPTQGSFQKFTADIAFDPQALSASHANITVDLKSAQTTYAEIAKQLNSTPWFNTAQFPQATFTANRFTHLQDKDYTAQGSLTLRGIKLPVGVKFTLVRFDDKGAEVKGSTMVKRLLFGIGQGQWADTSTVMDDVLVEFHIYLKRKV